MNQQHDLGNATPGLHSDHTHSNSAPQAPSTRARTTCVVLPAAGSALKFAIMCQRSVRLPAPVDAAVPNAPQPRTAYKPANRRMAAPAILVLLCSAIAIPWGTALAQVVFQAVAINVVVNAGTQLVVKGDLQLHAGTIIANTGIIHAEGDWTNSSGGPATTATSTGSIILNGGVQDITGTDITDFRNLVISGGEKTLLLDAMAGRVVATNGTLDLDGAVLHLNGHSFTVFNPASIAVVDNGGSVRSESTDLLSRFIWALGADVGTHTIPFSNASGVVLPFSFTPSAAFPTNTLLAVATYPTAVNNTPFPLTANEAVLHMAGTSVADNSANTVNRFWLTDLPDASFTGTLQLSYAPADDAAMGASAVRAQRWLEAPGTWQSPLPGQTNPALRQVQVPAIPFSNLINPEDEHIWALAYDATPLPVTLIAFDAQAMDNTYTHCTWTTANELNSDHFTVERSQDARNFEAAGTVPAAGISNTTLEYAWDDPTPYPGISYYRLRQTDLDGGVNFSPIVPVTFATRESIGLFPNPNNGSFSIHRAGSETTLAVQLMDATGREVWHADMAEGQDILAISLALAPGCYPLRWSDGRIKFVVER